MVAAPASGAAEPSPDVVLETGRPLPLPDGLDEAALRALYATWSIYGEPRGHMDPYVGDSFCRFLHTYGLVAGHSGRCLELGANPYFTTYLFDEHTDLELTLANYFGHDGVTATQRLTWLDAAGHEHERRYDYDQFNIEESTFPYPDGTFDVVVFAEILEHLLMDPVGVLLEIRRVLAAGGTLVLTTPNVARAENAFQLVAGANIYDPYSGYGPYGRHNREYTMAELQRLLRFLGFEIEESFTADGHPTDHRGRADYGQVAPLLARRADELGGYLFVRARVAGPPGAGFPTFLYRSWPADRMVEA